MAKHFDNNKNSKRYIIKSKKSSKTIFISLLFCLSIIAFIVSIYFIINWFKDSDSSENIASSILDITTITEVSDSDNVELVNPPANNTSDDYWDFIKTPLISVDFNSLLERNPDTVGWIRVNNTNINYPIVQSNNNSQYLKHAFDGSSNRAGWIFADYRNDMKSFDKNTIIYGHSRLNQTMFGSLKNVLERSWYENKSNRIILLSTPSENTLWQVFSVYTIEPESYYITTSFSSDESYQSFLNTIKSRSIYDFGVNLSTNDKTLTLSTCSDTMGTGRIVVHSKLIKREVR